MRKKLCYRHIVNYQHIHVGSHSSSHRSSLSAKIHRLKVRFLNQL